MLYGMHDVRTYVAIVFKTTSICMLFIDKTNWYNEVTHVHSPAHNSR